MRNLVLTSLFILSVSFLTAQTDIYTKDMVVNRAELTMNEYAPDSLANSMVLYERGESYFDKHSFRLVTQVMKKVKIFNRSGFDRATVEIPLYFDKNKEETISDVKGVTYNLIDNKITHDNLSDSGIFLTNYNNKLNVLKFTFPNIKEGSVLTYSYNKSSPFPYKFHGWNFQDDVPKLHSEYHSLIPANYDYNIKLVGLLKLYYHDQKIERNCLNGGGGASADCTRSVYIMKDIPAFIDEDYMTARENYLAGIDYELKTLKTFDGRVDNITKTWKSAEDEIKGDTDLGRDLRKSSIAKNLLPPSIANINGDLERAEAIYHYVQDNYTDDENYKMFFNVSVKDLVKNKTGSSVEINSLLHNLLQENNFEVKPLLVSTRDHGLPTKLYPVISDFNYLLIHVKLDDKSYLLDASNNYLSFGEIPFKTLNKYGRLLDFKGESTWFDIVPGKSSIKQQYAMLEFKDLDSIVGIIKSRSTGYHSLTKRESYYDNPRAYTDYYKNNFVNPEILNHQVIDGDRRTYSFVEQFDVRYMPDKIGDKIYVNPFVFKFFNDNPFKLQNRTYPIDFGYGDSYTYSAKINLGDNLEIDELPESLNLALPNNTGMLIFSAKAVGNGVELILKVDFKQSIYNPTYYTYIKELMAKFVEIQKNTLIVLKRK